MRIYASKNCVANEKLIDKSLFYVNIILGMFAYQGDLLMQKTLSERMVSTLLSFGKKHKGMKHLMIACIFVVLTITYIFKWICSNTKKLSLTGLIILFFFACSSFSFPSYSQNEMVDVSDYMTDSVISLEATGHIMLLDEEVHKIVNEDPEGLLEEEIELETTEETSLSDDDSHQEEEEDAIQFTLEDILATLQLDEISSEAAVSYANSGTTFKKDDWNLLLVNKQHPIPDGVEPVLCNIAGDKKCDERVVGELLAMMQAAKDDGVSLMVCSAHRDYDYQVMLFQRKITKYMNRGYSYIDAYQLSSQAVTLPGFSEHQLGLAFDIVTPSYVNLNSGFAKTSAGIWLKENAYKYGFILRYPEGKEFITGIEFEPWHYRYVGVEAATIIMENELTLEEFTDHIEDYACINY